MSLSLYNVKYELKPELTNENTIIYDRTDLNKLGIIENENLNHFSCKAILFYILAELNHDVIADFHIVGVGNVDLYDLTARTIYTLKTFKLPNYQQMVDELYPDSELDVIAIDLENLPDDIFQRYLQLREFVSYD